MASNIPSKDLQQIQAWNSRVQLRRKDCCVHDIITQQCRANPSAEAISAWDGSLTYSQLDRMSTTLASHLVCNGCGPNKFIALLFNKSMWTAVSLLAVLKAGSAIFLVDPSLPDQRIKRMCEIAEAAAIITSSDLSERARQYGPDVLIAKDECDQQWTTSLLPKGHSDQAVYLAFTSGSTGDPKAVVVQHAAVCSGMDAYSDRMGLGRNSRMFQFASYSFVISILDHLGALMNGACLCVPSSDQIQNSLASTLREFNANWVEITPSVARALDPNEVPGLGTVVLTGEAATRLDLERWTGRVDLKTCYGQSENSLGALVDNKTDHSEPSDMGYPWAAHCFVVDPHQSEDLVPIGAEGELWLAGPSLARGYLNNEEQTAATFIENPAWFRKLRPGESRRFLKTGDLVRYRPETGLLQYVGRLGTQVKLRGQRIELAEVEVQLKKQFPEAEATVAEVVSPTGDDNDALLVAFVTMQDGKVGGDAGEPLFAPTTEQFSSQCQNAQRAMQDVLPRFMVPTTFLSLTSLPLTPSGKLNRKLLRSKASELGSQLQAYHMIDKEHRRSCSDGEIMIRDICAEILDLDPESISMNATFFGIGGNSISTMTLISRAREVGFSFTAGHVFQQMSLAELAEHRGGSEAGERVRSEGGASTAADRKEQFKQLIPPGIDPETVVDIFPCTRTQQWLHNEGGCFLLRFSGSISHDRLRAACQRLIDAHTALRSLFTRQDGRLYQVVLKRIEVPLALHPHTTDDALSTARGLCALSPEEACPLDIPPIKLTLVSGSARDNVLIIQLSHAQYDALCQQAILSDLCTFYKDPNHPVESIDFAPYMQSIVDGQTPEALTFWKRHLADPTTNSLPTPPPSPQQRSDDKPKAKETLIRSKSTMPIHPLPRGITLATAVKAAWSLVLRQKWESDDVIFAQLVSTRDVDVPGIHRTMGPCLNRVPVRVQHAKHKRAQELLHAVQEQQAQSLPHQAAEWESIVSNATGWPKDTQPMSHVIHLEFGLGTEYQIDDGVSCCLADYIPIDYPAESIDLMSEVKGDILAVELTASSAVVTQSELEQLLERFRVFCQTCWC
ncbi:putative nonribosomal peptide synthase [Aspergillus mulundensis]|uniref:Carrier domain-containing protein n=1 Tax=Aspergillus mulundensis TaxID=1810919 RepID=A0A3D8T5M0_9EURO|nr:Uncharacterized protein DSM5745_01151 [Aspergillus mulundensis]RDW93829.1 Uncharacterized protein DSM5745_01151 [Aspergillus mulundensis]